MTLALGGYLLLYLVWLSSGSGSTLARTVLSDLAFLPMGAAAVVFCGRIATHPQLDAATRRAWRYLAAASLLLFVGDLLWFGYEGMLGTEPFPSLADVGFVGFYPLCLMGLLAFPLAPRTPAEKLTFVLDAGMILIGGGLVAWHLVLRPTALLHGEDALATALALAYPLGDLVLALGITSILLRHPQDGSRQALRLLVGGLFLLIIHDLAFAYLQLHEAYTTASWPDALWMLARFLMVVSAQHQYHWAAHSMSERPAVPHGRPVTLLPYLFVTAAYGLLLTVTHAQWSGSFGLLLLGAVTLTALVVVRQVVALRENAQLLAEKATRRSEARLQALVQHASDIILVIDAQDRIRYVSPSIERVLGYRPEEVLDTSIVAVLPAEDAARVVQRVHAGGAAGTRHLTLEVRVPHQDGGWRYLETVSTNLLDDPTVQGVVVNARDITERKQYETQLLRLASHDPLTGLVNRRRFAEEVERQMVRVRHHGARGAVLFLDLDHFKAVNDGLGHRAGDELLVSLAQLLLQQLRKSDVLARLGGDEFAVLLPDIDQVEAQTIATRLVHAVRDQPIVVSGQLVRVTASVGLALYPNHGTAGEALLAHADIAMYAAKGAGRNRCCVYMPDRDVQAELGAQRRWDERIRAALASDAFLLHAQPIHALHGPRVQYELLLRMVGADGEVIPPGAFLGVAERSGLIQAIDRWVVRTAIQRIAAHRAAGAELQLAVNLSGAAFADPELLSFIRSDLRATAITPANLTLEITETAAIADISEAQRFITTLKGLGCRFALDDFGVGFSSFAYLKHLPVDDLKLDGSFIRNLAHDPSDQHLVKAMVELARGLGKQTIAECVEDEHTLELLRRLGVDYAQGYYLGRPAPLAEPVPGGPRALAKSG